MDVMVLTYAAYLLISVALTVWVARVLSSNGRAFLVDVFAGDGEIADSVNRLLVVGFYLINLGYVCLALRIGGDVNSLQGAFEVLSWKVGLVMLVLGAMHLFNFAVFSRVRRSAVRSRGIGNAGAPRTMDSWETGR